MDKPFLFLDLSPEPRIKIYRLISESYSGKRHQNPTSSLNNLRLPGLFFTCQQTLKEGLSIFFAVNDAQFLHLCPEKFFLLMPGRAKCRFSEWLMTRSVKVPIMRNDTKALLGVAQNYEHAGLHHLTCFLSCCNVSFQPASRADYYFRKCCKVQFFTKEGDTNGSIILAGMVRGLRMHRAYRTPMVQEQMLKHLRGWKANGGFELANLELIVAALQQTMPCSCGAMHCL